VKDNITLKNSFMEIDYSAFCHQGASFKVEYSALPTGVELLTVIFTPPEPFDSPPVIFIPGLGSVIENFRETVIELTRHHTVYYLETREKKSAVITGRHRFTVEDITSDLVHFAAIRFPAGSDYFMAGYSLGATAIAEAFRLLENKPERIVLIEPNISFPFQGWLLFLARAARVIYYPLKPFLKWYLRRFRINLAEDYEMYRINCRILDSAEPARLGAAIRHLSGYRMSACLQEISVPSLVVVASKDKFHSHDEGTEIARQINGARYIDLADNKRTHSSEMGRIISDFISSPAKTASLAGRLWQDIF
jgi:pimeloyl-ACP methyl ester carboxylesterase